jgi:hypothetical protein
LHREEEIKWAQPQRAKVKHIEEGGNDKKYFHLIANGKHGKNESSSLSKMMGPLWVKRTSRPS